MKKYIVSIGLAASVIAGISWHVLFGEETYKDIQDNVAQISLPKTNKIFPTPTPSVVVKTPPVSYEIQSASYVAQTFNNCGPASLSMIMSYFGTNIPQDTLREQMRPYNNPAGGVDDKSIFTDEYVEYAKKYGFEARTLPNGTTELLKTFIANDIPVVLRTWLHPGEDIGHFRIVRGYDESRKVFIQDDSYEGKDLTYDYGTFNEMWKPFNYGYILVYPPEKKELVDAILKDEKDGKTAYQNSVKRAQENLSVNPDSSYDLFNLSTAYYHLGDYAKSVEYYEKSQNGLPSRMLWYQLEPLYAYWKTGNTERLFSLTERILNNNNIAFSELYFLRGQAYLLQNNQDLARAEFEKAVLYNKNFTPAINALSHM